MHKWGINPLMPCRDQQLFTAFAVAADWCELVLLSARILQASRRYCSEPATHFRTFLCENWTDVDKTRL